MLGAVYNRQGEHKLAEEVFLKSLEINRKLKNKLDIANSYANLGLAYKNQGELLQAKKMLGNSLQLFEALGNPNTQRVQQLLDEIQI